ncbi:MAG: hypothetical protein RMJ18_02190 [Candidatus Aenigmarchaeota archaeon]|nr:hypothetical protein [Candidatus Aenigmarchaeota archaeon]MDW8160204.1 hypothetical protein [Candidatus Aenigmarchaeota archaeon]
MRTRFKVFLSFIIFLYFCFFSSTYGFAGLQKQKSMNLKVNETGVFEILLWSDREEVVFLNVTSPKELLVTGFPDRVKLSKDSGDEIIVLGESYRNATKIAFFVKPISSGSLNFSVRIFSVSDLEGLVTKKEIVFNFFVNSTEPKFEGSLNGDSGFLDIEVEQNYIMLLTLVFLILLTSFLIYKKS